MEPFSDVPNHRLLFHGSALQNFIGILSQGLRIAPVEAQHTGNLFGRGLYFADMFSKSAGYSRRNYQSGSSSYLMLICEVVVGTPYERWEYNW